MSGLEQRSIIITGGGSGIGEATAIRAAAAGALVTVADIDDARGRSVVEAIREQGGEAQFVHADVGRDHEVQGMIAAATSAYGALHGAFNNAALLGWSYSGGRELTRLADMPTEAFRRAASVNVVGTFLCLKHEITAMLDTGGGSIVNTSGAVGVVAIEFAADYVASKHAVIGLTKAAALDYATQGVRVNALLPGITRTPAMEASFAQNPELEDWAAGVQPNKRVGEPSEVAEAALWLLSDASSLVTGVSLPVDGGFLMV